MNYGICLLTTIPGRNFPSDKSEMVTQFLFGEIFSIEEQQKNWLLIKSEIDQYICWIDKKQCVFISENDFLNYKNQLQNCSKVKSKYAYIQNQENSQTIDVVLGSLLYECKNKTFKLNQNQYKFNGELIQNTNQIRKEICKTANVYLNTPYLWGGKTPFGIDCSAFVQVLYRLYGIYLPRDAKNQAKIGKTLSFVEESQPGDVAFFDNDEGEIIHTGILLNDKFIIHASGKVRIDRIDHFGIYNNEVLKYTHKLRLLKTIIK